MAWFPGAIRKPITAKRRSVMTWYRRVNLHVAVSEASTLFPYFNQKGIADSHFYVRKDGTVEQYVDTKYQAYADLEGNDATISIETQGGVNNTSTEKWTDAQVTTLAKIYAWAVKIHDIPVRIAEDSKIAPSSYGLSWHRLGIDGSFPPLPSILAGRLQRGGGMRYSHSAGKVCPGDAKIRQVPRIFELAKTILKPTPPKDWFEMATEAQLKAIVEKAVKDNNHDAAEAVWRYRLRASAEINNIPVESASERLIQIRNDAKHIRADVKAVPEVVKASVSSSLKGVDLDPVAVAEAVVDALPDGMSKDTAERVLAELSARLGAKPTDQPA